ncbi:MAG: hemolysin family protein [Acidimicrobiia bacterium]
MIQAVVLPIVVVIVLVAINGLFVAAEFALVGSRRSRLQTLADGGSRVARWLVGVFDDPTGKDSYIAVAQLGITLASVGLGMYGEPAVAAWLYEPLENLGLTNATAHTLGFILALSAITYMHVVFGEMIPKALALQGPEQVSVRVNPVVRLFGFLFRPMVRVLNAAAFGLMRLLRIPEPDRRLALYTSSELAIVTDEAADSGQLGEMQRNLISKIFDLDARIAEELMTSRSRIEAIDVSATPEVVIRRIESSPRSRYPIIDGSLDNVVGVLHIKDFIRAREQGSTPRLESLARALPTVAATATAEQLLTRFKKDRTHASLVIDEFGNTLGFVTLDDIVAEVMDDELEMVPGLPADREDGFLSLDGETTLAELKEDHGIEFIRPGVTTIAGLLLAGHGTVPEVGASIEVHGHQLVVEEMEGRKITRVLVRALDGGDD